MYEGKVYMKYSVENAQYSEAFDLPSFAEDFVRGVVEEWKSSTCLLYGQKGSGKSSFLGSLTEDLQYRETSLLTLTLPLLLKKSKAISLSCFEIFLDEIKDLFEEENEEQMSAKTIDEVLTIDILNSVNSEQDLMKLYEEFDCAFVRRKQVVKDSTSYSMSTCVIQIYVRLPSEEVVACTLIDLIGFDALFT